MKYLYSWLKEYYPQLPSIEESVELMSQLGHEAEHVEKLTYAGVIVAEVKAVHPHPNADKLRLANVSIGDRDVRVVCGAPNLEVGQKVPYATFGAALPCGLTIKAAKIRGEESEGMLCAPDELGLGASHEGLLVLPADAVVGDPLTNYVDEDAVLSLEITRNRGDVLSHFGLARDLHAAHAKSLLKPTFKNITSAEPTPVVIGDIHPDADSVSFGAVNYTEPTYTPLIMQSRLNLLGQKVINLPTDITNYLLLGFGQPLHAYDADKLSEQPMFGVRRAHSEESFIGLNGKTYALTPENLVITDHDKAVAIAGIHGGDETKVTDKTTRVIIESAHFNPKAVGLGSRALSLSTEGATRWERGVDPHLQASVLSHAQALLTELTGGTSFAPMSKETKTDTELTTLTVSPNTIGDAIGQSIDAATITSLLTSLGFAVEQSGEDLKLTVPSWRSDISATEDIVEEVVRMIGVQTLPKKSLAATVPQWKRSKWWRQEYIKDMLVSLGGQEIMTYPFMSDTDATRFTPALELPVIRTAPVEGKKLMRASLIPGALNALALNPETPFIVFFEVAKVYAAAEEPVHLCISVCGSQQGTIDAWWQNYFERLRLPVSSWMSRVMTLDADTLQQYKIRKPIVTALELPISDIIEHVNMDRISVVIPEIDTISYTPLSKYQMSRRDIACIVSTEHDADAIAQDLRNLDPAIVDVTLFDIYRDPNKIGANMQSLAMHIGYQADDRTLTNDEITALHERMETYLKEHYHATIR